MSDRPSLLTLLSNQLDLIEDALVDLVAQVPVRHNDWSRHSGVLVVAPNFSFGPLDEKAKAGRISAHKAWERWKAHLDLLLTNVPKADAAPVRTALSSLDQWIGLSGSNWSLSPQHAHNAATIRQHTSALRHFLEVLAITGNAETLAVPDTNALIANPEAGDYGIFGGGDPVTVVFLPTVLGELDRLKIVHRNEDFRKKVESIIRRLKEFQRRGDVTEGVRAQGNVSVRFVAHEPRFEQTLPWLDKDNEDDRIIAATLELQRENPSARVLLVTADINHQNKAAAALIPFEEPPPPVSGQAKESKAQ
jgi:hypothetical protein